MKKLFNTPEMAITSFDVENIITTSIASTETYKETQNTLANAIGAASTAEAAENIIAFTFD